MWFAITPELELVSAEDYGDSLRANGGPKEYFRHIIMSYYHALRCDHEVYGKESSWRDEQGMLVTFRRGHLRRISKNAAEEQAVLAKVEQNFDLRRDNAERQKQGLPIRTYVKEVTNPYLITKPMKVSAPHALRTLKTIV